jgi:apolipoprotein N-acyltransferase
MPVRVFPDVRDLRWNSYEIDFARIAAAAAAGGGGTALGKINREISIILTNDSEIRELNKKYRHISKPTNVLSFESGDSELLGDIYISFDSAMRESGEPEFAAHVAHLVVHGVLHLLGHDHLTDSEAEKMEALEVKILAALGLENPYSAAQAPAKENSDRVMPKQNLFRWLRGSRDRGRLVMKSILAILCGGVMALGFAPFNLWWATIIGIGCAYRLICASRKPAENADDKPVSCALCSALFGASYACASFWWVLNSIYVVPELAAKFAVWTIPGIIGIAIAGALVFSIPFLITNLCMRRFGQSAAIRPILFAASWTLVLWLREWLMTGFPWNPVANIAMPFPALANSMSLWGALGLTFMIVGLIAGAVELGNRNREPGIGKYAPFVVFSALLIVGIVCGYGNIRRSEALSSESPVIRIVQPAFSQEQKASHSREQAIANAEENMRKIADMANRPPVDDRTAPDIIIFPETAHPFVIMQGMDELALARELGRPVITGATSWNNGRFYNSMIVAGADGKIQRIYSKSHLVPFGEYRPFGDIIPTPGQLSSGDGPEAIGVLSTNFVPAICYEIIFSDSLIPSPEPALHDPDFIANITNDAWFGKTPGTYQHLDMARRQAIESGLPVVRANYSGISAFIAADGQVISSLPIGVSDVLDGRVSGAHVTPYRRIGLNGMMAAILAFAAACAAALSGKRRRN